MFERSAIELPTAQILADDRYYWLRGREVDQAIAARTTEALNKAFGRWPAFSLAVPSKDHLLWKLTKPGSEQPFLALTENRDGVNHRHQRVVAARLQAARPSPTRG